MIASSVLMTAGILACSFPTRRMRLTSCIGIAALASLKADTLDRAYGLLILAGLGIGGIVVPASIMTTIVCADVSILSRTGRNTGPVAARER